MIFCRVDSVYWLLRWDRADWAGSRAAGSVAEARVRPEAPRVLPRLSYSDPLDPWPAGVGLGRPGRWGGGNYVQVRPEPARRSGACPPEPAVTC